MKVKWGLLRSRDLSRSSASLGTPRSHMNVSVNGCETCLWSVRMGLYVADKHCGRPSPLFRDDCSCLTQILSFTLLSNYLPRRHLSSVCSLLGQFHTAWEKDETVHCEQQPSRTDQHQGQRPPPHSHLRWVWKDQYWINTLWIIWQVLSTLCAPTCALYLDYWLSGCPQDLTCGGRTPWSLGLQTQALVSLAIDLLSPHLSLPVISVSPLVKVSPRISNKYLSVFRLDTKQAPQAQKSLAKMAGKIMGIIRTCSSEQSTIWLANRISSEPYHVLNSDANDLCEEVHGPFV